MRWIALLLFFCVVEFYSFQALLNLSRNKLVLAAYLLISIAVWGVLAYGFTQFGSATGQNKTTLMTLGLVMLVFLPKLIVTVFLIVEDGVRVFMGVMHYFSANTEFQSGFLPARRKFVSQLALGVAAVPFLSVLHGITKGRYRFRVIEQILYFDDLPEVFEGFKFTQISDIHCGSFDNREQIQYAVDLINQQDSDMLVFTGDLVNSLAEEMDPWLEVFQGLRTYKYGKFSVLGNHDYGEYVHWETQGAKERNFQAIKDLHPKMGFRLLLNEGVWIEKDGQRIALLGVENWGVKFKKVGDLNLASQGVKAEDFKILLSHDPSHWEAEVLDHAKNFQLMLAGHTHGAQFGIEIPGLLKWSPIQYIYKQWAGVYEKMGRFLYVNRGFGYHAYPGRVGIWPEVTVFQLRRRKK